MTSPNELLTLFLVSVFIVLAQLHIYWAIRGPNTPSRLLTLGVAGGLLACASLIAAVGGFVPTLVPMRVLCWFLFFMALVLLARAVGDFRLVGFFKKIKGTPFAKWDSLLFSPLCLVLSAGIFVLALSHYGVE